MCSGLTHTSFLLVDPNTPRDGTKRNPAQQDSTRFKGDAADTCGETIGAGDNDIQAGVAKMVAAGQVAQVQPGGMLMMTLHQVNGDGAGMSLSLLFYSLLPFSLENPRLIINFLL